MTRTKDDQMAVWNLAGRARLDFADMVASLSEEQMGQETLCEGWDAKSVLAHVVMFVELGAVGFFTTVARSGFNSDKAWKAAAAERRQRPTSDLLATLRDGAANSAPLPGFPEALTVTDTAIHTQDVRWPLDAPGSLDAAVLRTSLDFLTTNKRAKMLAEPPDLNGIRLVATDLDWSHGDGAEVSGTGVSLMMALARRPVLDELSGDGVARLR